MDERWLGIRRLILFSLAGLTLNVVGHLALGQQVERGQEAVLTGKYKGFVLLGDQDKSAVLVINEKLDEEGNNFVLTIEGESPISGRIAARSYPGNKEVFANLRFENEAKSILWRRGEQPSVSVSLKKSEDRITLTSVEKGKQFIFKTCLPPPGCKAQPRCEPC